MKKILLVGGMDPSGNAGLLKDINVLHQKGAVEIHAVVTANTAQNREKFYSANVVSPQVLESQLKALLPLTQYSVIKVGMVGSAGNFRVLKKYFQKVIKKVFIILDPVLISTTGGLLLDAAGIKELKKCIPYVSLVTPNWDEALKLLDSSLKNISPSKAALELSQKLGVSVLVKGGHLPQSKDCSDWAAFNGKVKCIPGLRVKGKFRGTGCALASLMAWHAIKEKNTFSLIQKAKKDLHEKIFSPHC